jgi:hypothetical protein
MCARASGCACDFVLPFRECSTTIPNVHIKTSAWCWHLWGHLDAQRMPCMLSNLGSKSTFITGAQCTDIHICNTIYTHRRINKVKKIPKLRPDIPSGPFAPHIAAPFGMSPTKGMMHARAPSPAVNAGSPAPDTPLPPGVPSNYDSMTMIAAPTSPTLAAQAPVARPRSLTPDMFSSLVSAQGTDPHGSLPTPTPSRAASPVTSITKPVAAPAAARSVTPAHARAPSPVMTTKEASSPAPRVSVPLRVHHPKQPSATSTPELAPITHQTPANIPPMHAAPHVPVPKTKSDGKGLMQQEVKPFNNDNEKKKEKRPNWPPWSDVKTKFVRIKFFTSATPPGQPPPAPAPKVHTPTPKIHTPAPKVQPVLEAPCTPAATAPAPTSLHAPYQYHPTAYAQVGVGMPPAGYDDDDDGTQFHATDHLLSYLKVGELIEVYAKNEDGVTGDWWNGVIRRIRIFKGELAKILIEYESEASGYNSGSFITIHVKRDEKAAIKWKAAEIRQQKSGAKSPLQSPQPISPQPLVQQPMYAPSMSPAAVPAAASHVRAPHATPYAAPQEFKSPAPSQDQKAAKKKSSSSHGSKSTQKAAAPATPTPIPGMEGLTEAFGRPPSMPAGSLVDALQQGMAAPVSARGTPPSQVHVKKEKEKDSDKSKSVENAHVKQEKLGEKTKTSEKKEDKVKSADKPKSSDKSKSSEKGKSGDTKLTPQEQASFGDSQESFMRATSPTAHGDKPHVSQSAVSSCASATPGFTHLSSMSGTPSESAPPASPACLPDPVIKPASEREPKTVNPVYDWPGYMFSISESPNRNIRVKFKKMSPYPPAKRVKFTLHSGGEPESWVASLERKSKSTPSGDSASQNHTPSSPGVTGGADEGPPRLTGRPNMTQYAPSAQKLSSPGNLDFGYGKPSTKQEGDSRSETDSKITSEGKGAFRAVEPSSEHRKEVWLSVVCVCVCVRVYMLC